MLPYMVCVIIRAAVSTQLAYTMVLFKCDFVLWYIPFMVKSDIASTYMRNYVS